MHMKMEIAKPRAGDLITEFAADGRYHFATAELRSALGVSAAATRLALHRLAKKGVVASPARGFYVIVPPEYRRIGCLPADQFIPALMERLQRPYYAALLSAAQYHGAAHHRPQAFQVALAGNRRPISCGTVEVSFIARKRIADVPVQSFNTPRGTILASSIEATAIDLVGYEKRIGGLDQAANHPLRTRRAHQPRFVSNSSANGSYPLGTASWATCSNSSAQGTRRCP